jgi:hypothetical protein
VNYWVTGGGSSDCGSIDVDGIADLPGYDNMSNVVVSFLPVGDSYFRTTVDNSGTGQQVQMALVAL